MRKLSRSSFLGFLLLISSLQAEEKKENTYTINFHDVPVVEFIQFVSRISDVNFIFNHRDLQFNISLASGKPVSPDHVVRALTQILRAHGYSIAKEDGYFVIHKGVMERELVRELAASRNYNELLEEPASISEVEQEALPAIQTKPQFLVYKLQYHNGDEMEETVRKIATDLSLKPQTSSKYLEALKSVQWIKATNSLVCSGDEDSLQSVKELIQSLDIQLRQVFIEVLVIETDARKTHEFGLQWAGKYKDRVGFGTGGYAQTGSGPSPFQLAFQNMNGNSSGSDQIPLGSGFDMGVIGNLIFHKGKVFDSLAMFVSALQADGETSIILNQKIITQDNKNSSIFVGDNIPFTGSIVTTVGSKQQSTANVEYRDIGVNLSLTPKLGEGEVITLELNQEITEAVPTGKGSVSSSQVTGIQTTKTNMTTNAHVPDRHFFVLSGMSRNARDHHKAGLPCLGGLPGIGSLFSKTEKRDEKRNVMIFVRPHIIRSMEDYRKLTEQQTEGYRERSPNSRIDEALEAK